jgi:hypothetical protein
MLQKVCYAAGDQNQAPRAQENKGKAEKGAGGSPEDGCVSEETGKVGSSDNNPEIPRQQPEERFVTLDYVDYGVGATVLVDWSLHH